MDPRAGRLPRPLDPPALGVFLLVAVSALGRRLLAGRRFLGVTIHADALLGHRIVERTAGGRLHGRGRRLRVAIGALLEFRRQCLLRLRRVMTGLAVDLVRRRVSLVIERHAAHRRAFEDDRVGRLRGLCDRRGDGDGEGQARREHQDAGKG